MDQSKQGGGETREDKIDGTFLQEREVSYGLTPVLTSYEPKNKAWAHSSLKL